MDPWLLLLLVKEFRNPPEVEVEVEEGKENQEEPVEVVETELEV